MLIAVTLLLLLFDSSYTLLEKVDYVNYDYCKRPCKMAGPDVVENSACQCVANATHTELFYQLIEFRKTMLFLHNSVRNKVAGGFLKLPNGTAYPKAANMRAISYSLEVEYTARCYAVKINDYHDKCRATKKHELVGQNLHFSGSPYEPYTTTVYGWFWEFDSYSPDYIGKFQSIPGTSVEKFAHFTQLAWHSVYTMGCARSFNPENHKSYRFAIFCNYEAASEGANMMTRPVYQAGEPCSACPDGTVCNKKFIYLCGEIDPLPMDPPAYIYKAGEPITTASPLQKNESVAVVSGDDRVHPSAIVLIGYVTMIFLYNYL